MLGRAITAILAFAPSAVFACAGLSVELPSDQNLTFRTVAECFDNPVGCDVDGIRAAWYDAPTTAYAHGVLGDAIEYDRLTVHTDSKGRNSCNHKSATLGPRHVFEDVEPRLADLDGDGRAEVIAIRTHVDSGAQLAVYKDVPGEHELQLVANTPYIGRTNRWLAPIGAADLDGDGAIELAYVDRPHLAKTIRIWRYENGRLKHMADLPGYTNHRIGEDNIAGGIRDCGDGPEMIVADANWRNVYAVGWDGEKFSADALGKHKGRATFVEAMACKLN